MTADEVQSVARRLSNQTWCRYWLNLHNSREPVTVAIQCRDENGNPEAIPDLEKLAMTISPMSPFMYVATRTNADGSNYVSEIF